MVDRRRRALTRRQFVAGGLGVLSAAAAGTGLVEAWRQLGREDLVPGDPAGITLEPRRWVTTPTRLSFAALGDNGSGGRKAMAVAEQLARSYRDEPFGLVSLLGDICYYGPIGERFGEVFLQPMAPLIDAGVSFELAIGNHDGDLWFGEGTTDVEATLELLGTPSRYYATTRGPADFFYLDSGAIAGGGPAAGEQLAWLEQALAAGTRPWRIVCLHHPLYSSGIHGASEQVRAQVEPMLVRHDVDLVLSGHDHHYERSVPIRGITHVISGAGCKLSPVDARPHAAVATATLEFVRIDIDGPRLTGRAIDVDGQEIDRFTLTARSRP